MAKATLTEMRLRDGKTIETLAFAAGVSVRTVQRIEAEEAVPTPDVRERIAEALGVAVDEIAWPETKRERQ